MKRIHKIILVGIACVVLVAIWVVHDARTTAIESYAVWDAANTIITHVERTGDWPRNWHDMEESFPSPSSEWEAMARDKLPVSWSPRSYGPWANVRSLVEIDFTANPASLVTNRVPSDLTEPPFEVVKLKSGKNHHWSGAEPNRLILKYLKEKLAAQGTDGDADAPRAP